jgi:hypothetical protein
MPVEAVKAYMRDEVLDIFVLKVGTKWTSVVKFISRQRTQVLHVYVLRPFSVPILELSQRIRGLYPEDESAWLVGNIDNYLSGDTAYRPTLVTGCRQAREGARPHITHHHHHQRHHLHRRLLPTTINARYSRNFTR